MATKGTVTAITASKKPRHPMRQELGEIWKLETEMRKLRRAHEQELAEKQRQWLELVENLYSACNVAPGTAIDTSRAKWMRQNDPVDPKAGYSVIDWSKEDA